MILNKLELVKLAVLEEQLKSVNKILNNVCPKIEDMHDKFVSGNSKIKALDRAVFGNGEEGLMKKVQQIDKKQAMYAGGIIVVITIIQLLVRLYL